MKSMLLSLACVGVSAVLFTGCAGNNNGVNTKSLNGANVIHQGNEMKQNAVSRYRNLTGTNNANGNANGNVNGNMGARNGTSNVTNSHILQLGNWLRIVGSDGRTGSNLNQTATSGGSTGKKGRGIASFSEQSTEHVVVMTVDDPKAVQAIDRINRILSNKTNLRSQSQTLVKDLSYVLQSAHRSGTDAGSSTGTRATR